MPKVSVSIDANNHYELTAWSNPLVVAVATSDIEFHNQGDLDLTLSATNDELSLFVAAGATVTTSTEALGPFDVSVLGGDGTALTIIRRYTLTPSVAAPPAITVAPGAKVRIECAGSSPATFETTLNGGGVNIFVGETGDQVVARPQREGAVYGTFVVAESARIPGQDTSYQVGSVPPPPLPGTNDLYQPLTGTITVSATKKKKLPDE